MNSFPQSVAANHEPNSESAAPEQIPAKILVVDDESDLEILFRQMFRREIRKSEMSFAFVHNGQQALDKLALENDFDMVLSDIRMPQMDGLTLLAKLNKEYPTLKAVMVTAYGDMENIRRAMNGGAFDFISKPIQYHDLKATIEKTLNHVKELKELHRAREERIQAQARLVTELRKLDKMKDEFLANTSHELRTPLNGIIGIVESLLAEAASDKARANLELVLQSGKRLAHLVNEILDFAKLKNDGYSLRREPLRLDRTIRAVLQLSEPLAREKNLELIDGLASDLPMVDGDVNRIQQIVHNLVGNAIKFTQEGFVRVEAEVAGDFVRVSVRDTGIGIPLEKQDEIFEAFRQGDGAEDRSFDGTGLGLSITRTLVNLHGGTIEVTSRPGEGSMFNFTLPVHGTFVSELTGTVSHEERARTRMELPVAPEVVEHQPQVSAPLRVPPSPRPSSNQPLSAGAEIDPGESHIMVVDDNPINIQVLVNHLNAYKVSKAASGPEALSLLEREHFDLILLDVMMPGMTGYEVCSRIRQVYSPNELPVLLITAKNQTKDLVMGLESGANDYITKPFAMKELLARVKTHLQLSLLTKNLKEAQSIALENARSAGKADFATSVLHNVGNILSNIKVSCSQTALKLSQSKITGFYMAADILKQHQDNLDEFLTRDPKGRKYPEYFIKLADVLRKENEVMAEELVNMKSRIFMMEDAIETQQYYARDKSDVAPVVLKDLVEESLAVQSELLRKARIEIVRDFQNEEPVQAHRAVLIQILVNIVKNAIEAMYGSDERVLRLFIGRGDNGEGLCRISDTGVGIADLGQLFRHGYSTKENGHGFGLHYCKEAMIRMGGDLLASSEGPGRGASFTLVFGLTG